MSEFEHAPHRLYGEHHAIARLVCLKEDMDKPVRYWERPYYTDCRDNPDKWIRYGDSIVEMKRE